MNTIGKKTLIVGCGGAGKSYLAARLGQITRIPVVHLDKLYWLPDWVTRSAEEFDGILNEICTQDSYIMDGNYMRTMPRRLKDADTVLWLDFSTIACVFGVLSRIRKNRGRVREDMGEGCPERFDLDFMRWIVGFRKNTRPKIVAAIADARARGVKVTVLKSRRQVNAFIKATAKRYAK